jgi:outer membrane lipoprotein SlyB
MKNSLLLLLLLSGCSSTGVDRRDQNVITKEFYASIESIQQVQLASHMKTGIVGGAAVGVIDELDGNHEDMIAGALAGALVGGVFTAILEGNNKAYQYNLKSSVEGEFTLIQKEKVDTNTGCVKVRVSSKTTIHNALKEHCL